jgi:hypothetical protein
MQPKGQALGELPGRIAADLQSRIPSYEALRGEACAEPAHFRYARIGTDASEEVPIISAIRRDTSGPPAAQRLVLAPPVTTPSA